MTQQLHIPAAELISSRDHLVPGQLRITEFRFEVPLDYSQPEGHKITLFARRAVKNDTPAAEDPSRNPATSGTSSNGSSTGNGKQLVQKPYMVYLEGGPGFGNNQPQDASLTRFAISKGYQVLYIDHRGTGLSTPVSADMLEMLGDVDAQVDYMRKMRQDNTVRDCEAVRKLLTRGWPDHKAPWSIFGQSYGGFVSLSYLSMHPEGLREVFLTGGLAPVGRKAEEVYQSVFPRVAARNQQYYDKFPQDVDSVKDIIKYIEDHDGQIALPGGGWLTAQRLLTIGIAFGGHGGFDMVHNIILHLRLSLEQFGFLTRASLAPLEMVTPFDTNIIYAILHEAIYVDGPGTKSGWASYRVGQEHPDFQWLKPDVKLTELDGPVYFSGENIFPFHFETFPELMRLKDVAHRLAMADDWPQLYNKEQLKNNKVPVYAASYIEDMYVDNDFARETAKLVKGTKVFETNVMYHTALRAKTDEVLAQLFSLKEDVLD